MARKPNPSKAPALTKALRTAPGDSAVARVARAAEALRRGEWVRIAGQRDVFASAVETAPLATLAQSALLLLTHNRARTLKIRLYTPDIVALKISREADPATLRAIADPTGDLAFPLKGPFEVLREALPAGYAASVALVKLAGLLPATLIAAKKPKQEIVALSAEDIFTYDDAVIASLHIVTRARVPLEGAEKTELVAFRAADAAPEHYAIVIGAPPTSKPVLTRLHSECFTGDLLASLKCDCGAQLRGAIEAISKSGGGVLLYLAQEGRGIGLVNKLRAYRLQDQGFDTMEANQRLGFQDDERLYGIAAKMLSMLGYKSVRLMTNNPAKVAALKAAGVRVAARVPHRFPDNKHNHAYLATKAKKAGHLL